MAKNKNTGLYAITTLNSSFNPVVRAVVPAASDAEALKAAVKLLGGDFRGNYGRVRPATRTELREILAWTKRDLRDAKAAVAVLTRLVEAMSAG